MTERGCSEEFNTRTGMNSFLSSLSEPIASADSEEDSHSIQEKGEEPNPCGLYRRLRRLGG